MKNFQSLEVSKSPISNRWNFGAGLCALLLLCAGCASLGSQNDVPPVPVGPAGALAQQAPDPVLPPSFPARSPGWDAPEPAVPIVRSVTPLAPVPMDEEWMRVQIMLDRENFSPGCIDGRTGNQSRGALRAWQKAHHLPESGELDDDVRAQLAVSVESFTNHTVTDKDYEGLAPTPKTWRAKAQVAAMSYVTVEERLAEQYHLSQRALRELNPALAWPNPPMGANVRVPNIRPYAKVLAARIEIHLLGKYLQVFDYEGKVAAHFPCSIAKDKEKRPVGELHIANAAENPNYTFKPELFAEDPEAATIHSSLLIPSGPNNPVGVAWLSLDRPGYGIHGTPHPEDIGRTESHGCFRLANWNARKLLDMVSIGIPVTVTE